MRWESICFTLGPFTCRLVALSAQYRLTKSYNRHRHAFIEVHYVAEGSCCFRVGEESCAVEADTLFCIGAGVYHSVKTASPDLSKMNFGVEVERTGELCGQSCDILQRLQSFHAVPLPAGPFASLLQTLRTAEDAAYSDLLFCEEIKAQMALLMLQLARQIPEACGPAEKRETVENRYAQYIEEFFNLNHSLQNGKEVLAARLCVSGRQLNRILHTLYGMSYREKLNEIRVEIARDLLQTTSKSMEEIAEFLGYSNSSNFTAFLKKSTGKTPSQIRREREIHGK